MRTSLSGKVHGRKREPGTSVLSTRLSARRSRVDVNLYSPSSTDFHQSIKSVLVEKTSRSVAKNGIREFQRQVWACRLRLALDSSTCSFLCIPNGVQTQPAVFEFGSAAHIINEDPSQERYRRKIEATWKPQHGGDDDDVFEQGSRSSTVRKCLIKLAEKSL